MRAVARAASRGGRVKAVGSGHSFGGIALCDGELLQLGRLRRLLGVDAVRGRVTVQAGISLARLSAALGRHDLALANLGDIAYQSVSGAIATGTHGTGIRFGGIATQVAGLRLVTGDGTLLDCSADREPELFRDARVGLGALGIVSAVTLQCVPAFRLHAVEQPERLDAVLEALDENVEQHDHFEFFWVPHTGWALTKRNRRTQEPAQPRGRWAELRDDYFWMNLVFGALCRLGALRPPWIPRLGRVLPNRGRVEYRDASHRVFASPRLVRFVEMEYAIPRTAAAEALRRVQALVKQEGLYLSFPVEVRFSAADDIALSPAFGRETCWIAVHVQRGMEHERYFRGVERIMDDYDGRPHWGKLHFQSARRLAARYPGWERFQALRARLDPRGVFRNAHLDTVLGLPAA